MKLRAARAAAGTMGGRKRVRARCVRMPKASMQWVHLSIYSFRAFPSFSPFFASFIIVPPAPEKSRGSRARVRVARARRALPRSTGTEQCTPLPVVGLPRDPQGNTDLK